MVGPDPDAIRDFDLEALIFYFQPVFRTEGGIAWFEALVRRDIGGIVQGPGGFLRAALAPEWIADFTDLAIDRILSALATTREFSLGLNLSPAQLLLPGTVGRLCGAEERDRLVVEVTEQPVNDPSALARAAYDLRCAGVRIVLDDITPRDAATRLLPSVDLDGIKLDREVIPRLLAGDRRALELIRYARSRSWQVTLEGIEDANLVGRFSGVDCVQGFAFGIPGPLRIERNANVHRRREPEARDAERVERLELRLGRDG